MSVHNHVLYDTAQPFYEFLFFYEDGSVVFFAEKQKRDKVGEISYLTDSIEAFKNMGRWGYYRQNTDTLDVSLFIRDKSRTGKIQEDWKMTIKDSNTILLSKKNCKRCKNQYAEYKTGNEIIFEPPIEYSFVFFPHKPDSSNIQIRRKKWFRQELRN